MYTTINRKKQREHYIGWENNDDDDDDDEMDLELEAIKILCYKDVTLLMLPNPEGKRDVLVMEVILNYTKGGRRNRSRRWFHRYLVLGH